MKKSIALILLVCLSIVACACSNADIDDFTSDVEESQEYNCTADASPNEAESSFEALESVGETPTVAFGEEESRSETQPITDGGERPLLTVDTFDEYTKMLNSIRLPDDFVSYEKISQFGDFGGLVFLSETQKGDFSWYMYNLFDPLGDRFVIYINSNSNARDKYPTETIPEGSIDLSNMRRLAEEKRGVYAINGIEYNYVSGMLYSITWMHEGVEYVLFGIHVLSNYPDTDSTLIGKLLNGNRSFETICSIFPPAEEVYEAKTE